MGNSFHTRDQSSASRCKRGQKQNRLEFASQRGNNTQPPGKGTNSKNSGGKLEREVPSKLLLLLSLGTLSGQGSAIRRAFRAHKFTPFGRRPLSEGKKREEAWFVVPASVGSETPCAGNSFFGSDDDETFRSMPADVCGSVTSFSCRFGVDGPRRTIRGTLGAYPPPGNEPGHGE